MNNYFALINNSVVEKVITVSQNDCGKLSYPESETIGQEFIQSLGISGLWIQTSVESEYRKHFAGYGMIYNAEADVFISAQPFPSWSLDSNYDWQPPVPCPENNFYWDEESLSWLPIPDAG
jgi:hypothetical protein